ncbi:MAG: tetratricopeptide repeat protein, partial [Brevinematales bacterium]
GSFAFSIGRYPEASQILQKAYSHSQDKETLTLLIMALFSSGEETMETIVHLASSLSPSPDFHPYAAYCIGKTYLSLGERDKAHLWFSNTLSYFPDDPNLLYGLALVKMDLREWEKAKEILLHALTLTDHPTLSYALGLCYLQTRDITRASSLFFSLCKTKKDANFCYEIALLFLKNHLKQEALPFLNQTLEYNPNHQEAMAYLRLLKNHKESPSCR